MTKDSHLMFEKYISSRKTLNESIVPVGFPNTVGGSRTSIEPSQTNTKEAEDKANSKRILQILDTLKGNSRMATQFALSPEEFASVIDWAKSKFNSGENEENKIGGPDATLTTAVNPDSVSTAAVGEGVGSEDVDAALNLKHKSEETEQEYLERRDKAIKAAIAAKEESEEQAALSSHYNTNHEALDLVDSLLNHKNRYAKGDVIKILSLALDKLNNKA